MLKVKKLEPLSVVPTVQEYERPLSVLEYLLLYTLAALLVILVFGKEFFLIGKGSLVGYLQWFVLTGLSYTGSYAGVFIAAFAIVLKIACNPKRPVLPYMFGGLGLWYVVCLYVAAGTIITSSKQDMSWYTEVLIIQTLPIIALSTALMFYGKIGVKVLKNTVLTYSFLLAVTFLINRGGVLGSALSNTEMSGRYLEENVIGTARTIFYCAFALIFWGIVHSKSLAMRILSGVACLLIMPAAFATGSRGPLFAFLVSVPLWIVLLRIKWSGKILVMGFVIVGLLIGFQLVGRYVPDATEHLADRTDSGRGQYGYSVVLNSAPTIFGRGTGSFAAASSLRYPHNLFLEMYYEHGVVGLLLLTWLMVMVFNRLFRMHKYGADSYSLWLLISFVYFFLCAQLSSALFQQAGLWMLTITGLRFTADNQLVDTEEIATVEDQRGPVMLLRHPETADI